MAALLAGAVGLEVVGYEFLRDGDSSVLYTLEVALEEFLEMSGVSTIFYGAVLFESRRQENRRTYVLPVAEQAESVAQRLRDATTPVAENR